jgi:transposase
MTITTIGLDTSKTWFQVHCVDADGRTVLRRKLARSKVLSFFANIPSCLVGLEACGGSHFWARELAKLGHDARLMPARYVRAYVKTNKHDAADAEACCEAVQRPGMRFVPVKTEEQQSMLMIHRARDLLVRQGDSESSRANAPGWRRRTSAADGSRGPRIYRRANPRH